MCKNQLLRVSVVVVAVGSCSYRPAEAAFFCFKLFGWADQRTWKLGKVGEILRFFFVFAKWVSLHEPLNDREYYYRICMNTWGARLPGDEVLLFFDYEEVSKIRGAFENALTVRHLSPSSSLFNGLLDNNVLALRGSSVYFNCYSIQKKTPIHVNGWKCRVVNTESKCRFA